MPKTQVLKEGDTVKLTNDVTLAKRIYEAQVREWNDEISDVSMIASFFYCSCSNQAENKGVPRGGHQAMPPNPSAKKLYLKNKFKLKLNNEESSLLKLILIFVNPCWLDF